MAKDGRVRGRMEYAGANPRATLPKPFGAIGSGLPPIDDVMLMFHMFRTEVSRIMRAHKPNSVEMVRDFDEARANLKAKLTAVGLAQHIDWRSKE